MKMICNIPKNHVQERIYTLNYIFNYRLGFKIEFVETENLKLTSIVIEDKKIEFKDHFFSKIPEGETYLKSKNLPQHIKYFNDELIDELRPILFGTETVIKNEASIILDEDIPASVFFMLSRWEENVSPNFDKLGRFSGLQSLAFQNDFIKKPVVDYWVQLIEIHLKKLGIRSNLDKNFKVIGTVDVDNVYLSQINLKSIIKTVAGDVLKRRKPLLGLKFLLTWILVKINIINDPYDCLNWMAKELNKVSSEVRFYFMSLKQNDKDHSYTLKDQRIKSKINALLQSNHTIGIHPSFESYLDEYSLNQDLRNFESEIKVKAIHSRQHYLRFKVPQTWQILNNKGISSDSSMYYPESIGFRCGTATPFKIFDIENRVTLDIVEEPLIFMEGTYAQYNPQMTSNDIYKDLEIVINQIKKFGGNFIFLWHNSSFNNRNWHKYHEIFQFLTNENSYNSRG